MKLVELKCKNCGAILKVEPESDEITCKYCQTKFKIDDEVKHVKFEDMEQNGYEFEKGRIRAQQEAKQINNNAYTNNYVQKEKNNTWLWVLGWIFCFPIPLTILIWRSKWEKKTKIIVTIVMWILILIIGYSSDTEENKVNNSNNNINIQENENQVVDYANKFITHFNSKSNYKIVSLEKFNAQNESSGHYRTEFRLNAWNNNISYSAKINDYTIDVIQYGNNYDNIRIYCTIDNLEIRNEIIKVSLNILDPSITNDDIDKILKTDTHQDLLLGESNRITGYVDNNELMIDSSKIVFN